MTRDEYLEALTEIGTIEDPAERRSKIVALSDEAKTLFDNNETLTTANLDLDDKNKKLQKYNMDLYLKVGGKTEPKEEPEPKTENLSYENLFNEKGELK